MLFTLGLKAAKAMWRSCPYDHQRISYRRNRKTSNDLGRLQIFKPANGSIFCDVDASTGFSLV